MMTEMGLEVLAWWLLLAVLGSWLNALLYRSLSRWIRGIAPALRSMVRLLYAASAPLAALIAVGLVAQPNIAGFLVPTHCHGLDCGTHAPIYAGGSLLFAGLVSFASLIALLMLVVLVRALWHAQRRLRLLSAFAAPSGKGYRTLDSTDLLACCVGFLRPEILLSRGLLEQLEPDEVEIVLAHERAHAKRLDNLRALLQRWLTIFWPASVSDRLHRHSRADAELACDLAAAQGVSDSIRVASVIRKLSRFSANGARTRGHRSVGFDCDDAAARIAALQRDTEGHVFSSSGWLTATALLSMSWCLQTYALTASSHMMIEWLGLVAI